MKKLMLILLFVEPLMALSQNPIIQTHFTADPAPMVYNDTLFLFVGCDEKDAPNNAYLMREYRLYTTTDMVNWTDCGAKLRTSDFKWSAGDASAAQCIERNGKFYWFISSQNKNNPGSAIGVAVGNSLFGPFKDALGDGLVTNKMTTYASHSWDDLDPTVFTDDNNQTYLYWGNGVCYFAKLNDDMISLASPILAIDAKDVKAFNGQFTEAPWLYKRNGQYYLVYASKFPECICYATAQKAEGPWKYGGVLMPTEKGSNTNHPGIVDYKGNSYFFYHNDALPGGHSYCRSVCVEQFNYNPDGSIPQLHMTEQGITKGVGVLNPFCRVEAETMAWSQGVVTDYSANRGIIVTDIHSGDYIKVRDVDFGKNKATTIKAAVSSRYHGGKIEVHTDAQDGELIATIIAPYTGEWENWTEVSAAVKAVSGVHDLYFVFIGRTPHQLFNFDYWTMIE